MTIAPTTGKELYAVVHSLNDTIALFSAMAHPCRLRMLILLAKGQVCDVTTLAHLCGNVSPTFPATAHPAGCRIGHRQPGGSTGLLWHRQPTRQGRFAGGRRMGA